MVLSLLSGSLYKPITN